MKNRYIKSGIWYIIGNLLIKGVSFLTLPIFTRLLGTSDFGKFNIFMSYENILNVVLCLGVVGTIKTAYIDFRDSFKRYFSSVLSLVFLFSFVVFCLLNVGRIVFGKGIDDFWTNGMLSLLVVFSLATALYNMISCKYVIEVEYKLNLAMSLIYTFTSIILSLILCMYCFGENKYKGRILGNAIPLIIITYAISFISIFREKCIIDKKYWLYALKMGVPIIFHSLSLVIMQQADKIMVGRFCGDSLAGIYSLACSISIILTIVQASLDNSWSAWFYRALNDEAYTRINEINKVVIVFFCYLTIGFALISPELIRLSSPIEYHGALYALLPLNVSVYCSFMYMFLVNKEYYFKQTRIIAIATVSATVINIALNALIIPKYGFISAAYTTLISKFILFVIHWYTSNKIDRRRVVNKGILMISLLSVCFFSILSLLLKNLIAFRYLLILLISICIFIYFKRNGYLVKIKEAGVK